jgi:outer membrane protein insertion porin family
MKWRHGRFRTGWGATALAVTSLLWQGAGAQEPQEAATADTAPVVERVEVLQNQYLQSETLLYYVSTRPGDRYDEQRLKDDFRRLWDTGFLDDLLLSVRDGSTGKVVSFVVKERRRVQIVDYRGSKTLTTSNIEDELKKKEAALKIDSFYDPGKARRVEAIIRQMLVDKGRPFATVKHEAKVVGGAGYQVSFILDDGPQAKVHDINFEGNKVFSDGTLRKKMKKIKGKGFTNLAWITGKNKFTDEAWSEDQKSLRDFYLNNGYVTASVGEPKVTYTDTKKDTGGKKKPPKRIQLDIPVVEGDQYRVGEIKFEGLTVFKEEGIRTLFKLKTGDVYNEARIKKGYDKLRDIYGSQGYFQWTGLTQRTPDSEKKVVDLVLKMEEDKRYFVGRINFTGNDTTRDKVIRREVYLNEGDVFNTEALKLSIKRINQLGYFKQMEGAPDLAPSPGSEDKLDVSFKVEEQNRNQFTFGGGVSGIEGAFINASFSTSNFLGMGETFQVSAQKGRRSSNYQIALTEPYLFDRSITAGVDVFKRRIRYESLGTGEDGSYKVLGYIQNVTGISLVTGLPVRRFSRLFLSYEESAYDPNDPNYYNPYYGYGGYGGDYNPYLAFLGDQGRRRESRITPSFVHNTVDNPYSPRSGVKYTLTLQLAGGPLQGTVDYFRPTAEGIWYLPHTKRTALGVRAEAGMIKPYAGTNTLPYYQRYFLGGETQIRGYNIRSIGPIDEQGQFIGGDKYGLFNAEYYFDVMGALRALLYFDAGQAFAEGQKIRIKDFQTSMGVELRFIMPVLNVPFRLIYAYNPNVDPRDSINKRSTFKFAVGTTF